MARFGVFVLSLCLACAASPAFAQVSATTGSINGKVSDATGGVLPGVTVTISSPSMQGTRTDVTNEQGDYRFPAVPPGEYQITYELAGFGTVLREGVRVGLGFTATVNTELRVASLQETVTVSGESPVVDVSTTTTATSFGQEKLSALPNARDFWTVLAAAPAVVLTRIDVGGSAAGTQTGYAAYDTKEDQHRPMVEGIVNTEGTGGSGFYYDYGSIDEVAIETKGHTAEMPWPGVWSNFIAKSGGNEYHGKLYADYQNESIQRSNIDDADTFLCPGGRCGDLQPSDLNRLKNYRDLNGDVGGYLKKDKIWWYTSLRNQNVKVALPNFPVKAFETDLRNISARNAYAVSQEQQDHRLRPVGAQAAAQPAGHLRHRGDLRAAQLRGLHVEAELLGAHLQDGLRVGPHRPGLRGGAGQAVPLHLAQLPLQRGSRLPGHRQPDGVGRQSRRLVPDALAQPDRGLDDVFSRTAGRATTTSRSAANGSVRPSPTSAASTSTARCPTTSCILNNGNASEVYLFASPSVSEQGLLTMGFYTSRTAGAFHSV
ncbi:MAG: carboxypeptidase-like regulatory domain-containing protein [Vicinamibacterales bacterium]